MTGQKFLDATDEQRARWVFDHTDADVAHMRGLIIAITGMPTPADGWPGPHLWCRAKLEAQRYEVDEIQRAMSVAGTLARAQIDARKSNTRTTPVSPMK